MFALAVVVPWAPNRVVLSMIRTCPVGATFTKSIVYKRRLLLSNFQFSCNCCHQDRSYVGC